MLTPFLFYLRHMQSWTCSPVRSPRGSTAPQGGTEGWKQRRIARTGRFFIWGQVDYFELFYCHTFALKLKIRPAITMLFILFSAWGPPPRKYRCEICVVEVPCYDTLAKHKLGKDHIKREQDLEACFQTKFKVTFRFLNNHFRREGRRMVLVTTPGQSPRSQWGIMRDLRHVLNLAPWIVWVKSIFLLLCSFHFNVKEYN